MNFFRRVKAGPASALEDGKNIRQKADDTQKATAIAKYGYKFPIIPDMVEDLAYNRGVLMLIIFSLYVVIAFTVVSIPGGKSNVPETVQVTSTFPNANVLRANIADLRAPRFRLLNGGLGALPGASFEVSVARKFQYSARGTIPCGDDVLKHPMFVDTLEYERVREACEPKIAGENAVANAEGLASFDDFRFTRGPPGVYELRITGEAGNPPVKVVSDRNQQLQVTSAVAAVTIVTPLPLSVELRKPLEVSPVLRVEDIDGHPVSNVTCVAFSSTEASFFAKVAEELSPPASARTFIEPGKRNTDLTSFTNPPLAHLMGQRLTTFKGATSTPSDATGRAVFKNLLFDASTTKTTFVCFYCEGVVSCWSDPESAGTGVKPPISERYKSPITLNTTVRRFELLSPVKGAQSEIITEGIPFTTQPRVRIFDSSGNPAAGVRAIAVLAASDGAVPPSMFLSKGSKSLAGFISEPSDADGVASFKELRFKAAGPTRGTTNGFTVSICVDGNCLSVASALNYTVKTSVTSVLLMRPPHFIRFNGTSGMTSKGDEAMPGETFSQANVPPSVIRVIGNGTTGRDVYVNLKASSQMHPNFFISHEYTMVKFTPQIQFRVFERLHFRT